MLKAIEEKLVFLYKFARAPRQIGSVTPSSVFLAKKMIEPVPWAQVKSVAELGAGTGAITRYLHKAIESDAKVLLFEKDHDLRAKLATQYPNFSNYTDACQLGTALQYEGLRQIDCILSGLPFFNFPQSLRERLMHQIVTSLKPGGLFIAFQYSQQMRKQLSRQLYIEKVHFVPWNVPPAFVYVCRKQPEPVQC